MSETATEPTQTPSVPKDEQGNEILTGPFESYHFIDQRVDFPTYCAFRRIVRIAGDRFAEVDFQGEYANMPPSCIKYVRIDGDLGFPGLTKCQTGDSLLIRKLGRKTYALTSVPGKGRRISQEEWEKIAPRLNYPAHNESLEG